MNLSKKYFYIYLKIVIFTYWIVITVQSLYSPMLSTDADAYSRLGLVLTHSDDVAWLPLYSKILSFAINCFNGSYFIGARLVTWVSILISSLFIEKIIFKSVKSSFLSILGLALFLFHPLVIDLSTITLTEPVWTMFVLSSFYFAFYSEKNKLFYLGLILFSVSQGIRYESWFLTPLLLLFLFISHKLNKKNIIVVLSSLLIMPVFWLIYSHFKFNNTFEFLRLKQLNADMNPIPQFGNFRLTVSAWSEYLTQFIMPIPMVFLYFFSLFTNKKSEDKFIWLVPLYLFITLVVQVYVKNMEYFALRYLFLVIPTVIISLMISLSNINQITSTKNVIKIFLIVIIFVSFGKIYFEKRYPFYSRGINTSDEVIAISKKINIESDKNIHLAFVHTKVGVAANFVTYLTQYKTNFFSYNCNDHIEAETKHTSKEAVKWLEQSEYLLQEINPTNNSCAFLIKNKTLVNKTKNFELYKKNDYQNP